MGIELAGPVDEDLGLDEPEVATAAAQLAASRGEDVLHPVSVLDP